MSDGEVKGGTLRHRLKSQKTGVECVSMCEDPCSDDGFSSIDYKGFCNFMCIDTARRREILFLTGYIPFFRRSKHPHVHLF